MGQMSTQTDPFLDAVDRHDASRPSPAPAKQAAPAPAPDAVGDDPFLAAVDRGDEADRQIIEGLGRMRAKANKPRPFMGIPGAAPATRYPEPASMPSPEAMKALQADPSSQSMLTRTGVAGMAALRNLEGEWTHFAKEPADYIARHSPAGFILNREDDPTRTDYTPQPSAEEQQATAAAQPEKASWLEHQVTSLPSLPITMSTPSGLASLGLMEATGAGKAAGEFLLGNRVAAPLIAKLGAMGPAGDKAARILMAQTRSGASVGTFSAIQAYLDSGGRVEEAAKAFPEGFASGQLFGLPETAGIAGEGVARAAKRVTDNIRDARTTGAKLSTPDTDAAPVEPTHRPGLDDIDREVGEHLRSQDPEAMAQDLATRLLQRKGTDPRMQTADVAQRLQEEYGLSGRAAARLVQKINRRIGEVQGPPVPTERQAAEATVGAAAEKMAEGAPIPAQPKFPRDKKIGRNNTGQGVSPELIRSVIAEYGKGGGESAPPPSAEQGAVPASRRYTRPAGEGLNIPTDVVPNFARTLTPEEAHAGGYTPDPLTSDMGPMALHEATYAAHALNAEDPKGHYVAVQASADADKWVVGRRNARQGDKARGTRDNARGANQDSGGAPGTPGARGARPEAPADRGDSPAQADDATGGGGDRGQDHRGPGPNDDGAGGASVEGDVPPPRQPGGAGARAPGREAGEPVADDQRAGARPSGAPASGETWHRADGTPVEVLSVNNARVMFRAEGERAQRVKVEEFTANHTKESPSGQAPPVRQEVQQAPDEVRQPAEDAPQHAAHGQDDAAERQAGGVLGPKERTRGKAKKRPGDPGGGVPGEPGRQDGADVPAERAPGAGNADNRGKPGKGKKGSPPADDRVLVHEEPLIGKDLPGAKGPNENTGHVKVWGYKRTTETDAEWADYQREIQARVKDIQDEGAGPAYKPHRYPGEPRSGAELKPKALPKPIRAPGEAMKVLAGTLGDNHEAAVGSLAHVHVTDGGRTAVATDGGSLHVAYGEPRAFGADGAYLDGKGKPDAEAKGLNMESVKGIIDSDREIAGSVSLRDADAHLRRARAILKNSAHNNVVVAVNTQSIPKGSTRNSIGFGARDDAGNTAEVNVRTGAKVIGAFDADRLARAIDFIARVSPTEHVSVRFDKGTLELKSDKGTAIVARVTKDVEHVTMATENRAGGGKFEVPDVPPTEREARGDIDTIGQAQTGDVVKIDGHEYEVTGKDPMGKFRKVVKLDDQTTGAFPDNTKIDKPAEPEPEAMPTGRHSVTTTSHTYQHPKTMTGDAEAKVTAPEIIQALRDLGDTPIRYGKGNFAQRQSLGWYRPRGRVIRLRTANDLMTAAHEVGHAVHYALINKGKVNFPAPIRSELEAHGFALYGYRKPAGGYVREGIAEYMAKRLAGENVAQTFPHFHPWFESNVVGNTPGLGKKLGALEKMYKTWDEQGPTARVAAQIDRLKSASVSDGWKKLGGWQGIKTAVSKYLTTDAAPLEAAERALAEKAGVDKFRPALSPSLTRRALKMSARGQAKAFIESYTTDLVGNPTGMSLSEVLQPIKGDMDNFATYLAARRAQVLHQQGISGFSNLSMADVDAAVKKLGSPEMEAAARGVTAFSSRVLDYLIDAGGLDRATADTMRAAYPIYAPFMRQFEAEDIGGSRGTGTGRGEANTPRPIKRIKGSGRQIADPVEAVAMQTERIITLANRVRVAKKVAALAESVPGADWFAEKVPADKVPHEFALADVEKQLKGAGWEPTKNADPNAMLTVFENATFHAGKEPIVALWRNGQREFWQLDPRVYETIAGMDKDTIPPWLSAILGKPKRAVQLGATGLSPGFSIATNTLRDLMTWNVLSTRTNVAPDLAVTLKGFWDEIAKHPDAQRWKALGGEMTTIMGQDRYEARRRVDEAMARTEGEKFKRTFRHPIDAAREAFGMFEAAPRIREFRQALEQAEKKYGKGTESAVLEALAASKEATVDFTRAGIVTSWVNQVVPFFNARVQGVSKFLRTFGGTEGKTAALKATARAFAWITAPSLALWMVNRDQKWYQELPKWEKLGFWHFSLDGGKHIFRIPKPAEIGYVFGSVPEAAADALYRQKPKVASDMVFDAAWQFLPVSSPTEFVSAALRPLVEVQTNWDSFRQRPIVSQRLAEGKPPPEQYTEGTTQVAKWIGGALNVSPSKVEHVVSGYSGGWGLGALRLSDKLGLADPGKRKRESTLADVPVLGRLVSRDPIGGGQSVQDFYEMLAQAKQDAGSASAKPADRGRYARLQDTSRFIANIRRQIDEGRTTEEEGRKKIQARVDHALAVEAKHKKK